MGVGLHGFHTVASASQLDRRLEFPQRTLEVARLFERQGHVHVRPNEVRIKLEGALIMFDRFIKLVRQMGRNTCPD